MLGGIGLFLWYFLFMVQIFILFTFFFTNNFVTPFNHVAVRGPYTNGFAIDS